jgi:hypothetical protein
MATAITQQEAIDLDSIEEDARRRIVELTEHRKRLSLDALGDDDAKRELATVESELVSAERLLEQAKLAGDERERRDQETRQQAEQKQQAAGQRRVEKLRPEKVKAEQAIDLAFAAAAQAVVSLLGTDADFARASKQAGHGQSGRDLTGPRVGGAWKFHFGAADIPHNLIDLPPGPAAPLAPEEN